MLSLIGCVFPFSFLIAAPDWPTERCLSLTPLGKTDKRFGTTRQTGGDGEAVSWCKVMRVHEMLGIKYNRVCIPVTACHEVFFPISQQFAKKKRN